MTRSSRHNSDEESRYNARKLAFEGNDAGLTMQSGRPPLNNNVSGYNSSALRAAAACHHHAAMAATVRVILVTQQIRNIHGSQLLQVLPIDPISPRTLHRT